CAGTAGAVFTRRESMTVSMPGLTLERKLWAEGAGPVAGLDEAGRGAWAGPVVAAAVILPPDRDDLPDVLAGVRDSKLCTPRQREALYPVVLETALAAAVGEDRKSVVYGQNANLSSRSGSDI